MQHARQIIFSFLCICNSLLSGEKPSQNGAQYKPIKITPLHEPSVSQEVRDKIKAEQSRQKLLSCFTAMDIEEMDLVFKSSPVEAQLIVNHLQDPTFFPLNEEYRSALFVGEPGSGKTTMAKAIAYKMIDHGWEYKFLSSTSLLGEHRNHTAIRLQKELEAIAASNRPTILIIDEFNRLLENADSKHHDTDATSTALWTFLDSQRNNKNFFFIGTTNRINKLPKPCKSRFLLDSITFPLMEDLKVRNNYIRKYLTTEKTVLDEEVTDEFLDQQFKNIGSCSGRDLKKISSAIGRESKKTEPTQVPIAVIKKAAIEYAMSQYKKKRKDFDYDVEEETDEQRQNRHHKENIAMQERHFIQQYMIQRILKDEDYMHHNGQYMSKEGKGKVDEFISDEQNQLYGDMMKNTYDRRDRETSEKAAAEQAAREAKTAKGWRLW